MSALTITAPIPPIQVAGHIDTKPGQNDGTYNAIDVSNLTTSDPKEIVIFQKTIGLTYVDYDIGTDEYGNTLTIDSCFFGPHLGGLDGRAFVQFQVLSAFGAGSVTTFSPLLAFDRINVQGRRYPPYIVSYKFAAPVAARYIRAVVSNPADAYAFPVGLFNVGLSYQPGDQAGIEWGSGRPIIDTGTATRLIGGGFGIEEGAIVGGFQWQFGGMPPAELARLYALLKTRGNTKPVWVVEDPDQTAGLNERTHYGLLTKIDAYERLDPTNNRYSLQMEEWA